MQSENDSLDVYRVRCRMIENGLALPPELVHKLSRGLCCHDFADRAGFWNNLKKGIKRAFKLLGGLWRGISIVSKMKSRT